MHCETLFGYTLSPTSVTKTPFCLIDNRALLVEGLACLAGTTGQKAEWTGITFDHGVGRDVPASATQGLSLAGRHEGVNGDSATETKSCSRGETSRQQTRASHGTGPVHGLGGGNFSEEVHGHTPCTPLSALSPVVKKTVDPNVSHGVHGALQENYESRSMKASGARVTGTARTGGGKINGEITTRENARNVRGTLMMETENLAQPPKERHNNQKNPATFGVAIKILEQNNNLTTAADPERLPIGIAAAANPAAADHERETAVVANMLLHAAGLAVEAEEQDGGPETREDENMCSDSRFREGGGVGGDRAGGDCSDALRLEMDAVRTLDPVPYAFSSSSSDPCSPLGCCPVLPEPELEQELHHDRANVDRSPMHPQPTVVASSQPYHDRGNADGTRMHPQPNSPRIGRPGDSLFDPIIVERVRRNGVHLQETAGSTAKPEQLLRGTSAGAISGKRERGELEGLLDIGGGDGVGRDLGNDPVPGACGFLELGAFTAVSPGWRVARVWL